MDTQSLHFRPETEPLVRPQSDPRLESTCVPQPKPSSRRTKSQSPAQFHPKQTQTTPYSSYSNGPPLRSHPSASKSPYNRTKCVWMRRQRYKYCESVEALTHFVRAEASQQHRRRNYKRRNSIGADNISGFTQSTCAEHRRVVTKIRIPISRIGVREDRGRIRIDRLASINRTPQQI